MRWCSIIAVASSIVVAATALCGAAENEPAATVTVRAAPIREAEAQAPTSFVTTIEAAPHAEQVETVADALAESVGVSVRRFGGLGAFSTVSIRGSSANQVQIYLDGVPLSRARNETVNLADLPLDNLERIDVYRGSAPVNLGTAGIGGVVNLVTKPASVTPVSTLSASYGSFDTRKVVATHSEQVHGVDLLAHVTYLGSAGNFRFLDDNETDVNLADDRIVTRRNNAFDSVDALLKGGYTLGSGLRLELTSETFFKDQGVPGRGQNQSDTASSSDVRTLNYLRLTSSDWLARDLDLAATLFGVYAESKFVDPTSSLATGSQDRRDQTEVLGGNLNGTYFITRNHSLGCFAEFSHETFSPFNALAPPMTHESDARRLRATLSVQDQLGLFDDRLLVVPTLRYEYVRDALLEPLTALGRAPIPADAKDEDLISPSIGMQLRPWPWLALRGNIGRFERAPNFSELFGNSGSVVGDPTLRPETALNRDVGVVMTYEPQHWLQRIRLEYAYFNNDIDDVIVFVLYGPAVSRPANIDAARIRGHELSLQATAIDHVRLDANYTNQDAENRSRLFDGLYLGKRLPERPAEEAYTRLELFSERGKVYYEFNFVGGNFLKLANYDGTVPGRTIHTIGATLQMFEPLTLGFEVRNLTDNQISDVADFPLPGRAFFGTATIKF